MKTFFSLDNQIRVNIFTLSFPRDLEKAFFEDHFQRSLRHVRMALLLAIFFYGIFGTLDAWLVPEAKQKLWLIRYAILLPFILTVFLFSFSCHFKKLMNLSIASVVLLAGLGIIAMTLIAPSPGNYSYYAGLILVFIYGYTFFKLRFIWATLVGWAIVIAYEITAIWLGETPIPVLVNNNFFFLTGNIFGMFACYSIELYSRKNFLQARLLAKEKEKVDAANSELEKRVEERTGQLLKSNKKLKQEIAERKRAEESLRRSEENYRTIFNAANDAIFVHDAETGQIIDVNQKMCEMYGYTAEEARTLTLGGSSSPYSQDDALHLIRQAAVGEPQLFEWRAKGKTGHTFWVEVNIKHATIGGKNRLLAIVRDITQRKHLEAQLLQSQKMETVGRLAGGVAHDFNNVLAAVSGNAEIAMMKLSSGLSAESYIKEIVRASDRGAKLAGQLLAFSRRQILEPKVINPNDILLDMGKMLRHLIGEDVELVTLMDENLGAVKADPSQIEQVLLNLAVNARDAMPDGGKLTIETATVTLDQDYASRHVSVTPGDYVMLAVSDTGSGMTEEVKAHIFEPFFTTKEAAMGTGLGLATCYGIVKQTGGNIWVYSEPGKGTTFKIYLPVADQVANASPARKKSCHLPRGTETVLLVEDESTVRDVAACMLRELGYTVLEAANGREALSVVQDHKGNEIQLLMTDVVMPKMSGKALVEKLVVQQPDIKVLFFSGYTDTAIAHHGILDSGVAFIQKPFSPPVLAQKVREVLDQ